MSCYSASLLLFVTLHPYTWPQHRTRNRSLDCPGQYDSFDHLGLEVSIKWLIWGFTLFVLHHSQYFSVCLNDDVLKKTLLPCVRFRIDLFFISFLTIAHSNWWSSCRVNADGFDKINFSWVVIFFWWMFWPGQESNPGLLGLFDRWSRRHHFAVVTRYLFFIWPFGMC